MAHFRDEMLARTPVRSAVGLHLWLGDDAEAGALLLYDDRPDFFTAERIDTAAIFADLATIALARSADRERAEQLTRAVATNRAIGQAIGIVMSRYGLTAEQAWDRLAEVSQRTHRKVHALAEEVSYRGELPE